MAAWKLDLYDRDPTGTVTLQSGGSTRWSAGTSVTLGRIFGHRDVSTTSCPGTNTYSRLGGVRTAARDLVRGWDRGEPAPAPTSAPKPTPKPAPTPTQAPRADRSPEALGPGRPRPAPGHRGRRRRGRARRDRPGHRLGRGPRHQRPPVTVVVWFDGVDAGRTTAVLPSSAAAAAVPGVGDAHGYAFSFARPPGATTVCVWAKDTTTGAGTKLGCPTVTVLPNEAPRGALDAVELPVDGVAGPAVVRGWVMDPDTPSPVQHVVTVDGVPAGGGRAALARPDLVAALGNGPDHGFATTVDLAAGSHQVCVQGVDATTGKAAAGSCREVVVAVNEPPRGSVDSAVPLRNSRLRVTGTAADPNSDQPVEVVVLVDGEAAARLPAAAAKSGADGPVGHVFDVDLPSTAGLHDICVRAADRTTGDLAEVGCTTVRVGSHRRVREGAVPPPPAAAPGGTLSS